MAGCIHRTIFYKKSTISVLFLCLSAVFQNITGLFCYDISLKNRLYSINKFFGMHLA